MLLGQIELNLRRWGALEEEKETTFNGLIPFDGLKLPTPALQAMDPSFVAQAMYSSCVCRLVKIGRSL